jgi:hypothetical protein
VVTTDVVRKLVVTTIALIAGVVTMVNVTIDVSTTVGWTICRCCYNG